MLGVLVSRAGSIFSGRSISSHFRTPGWADSFDPIILCYLSLITLDLLTSSWGTWIHSSVFCVLVVALSRRTQASVPEAACFFLGVVLPLIARFDAGTLRVAALICVCLHRVKFKELWFPHLLVVLWSWLAIACAREIEVLTLPLSSIQGILSHSVLAVVTTLRVVAAVTIFAGLSAVFSIHRTSARAFTQGVIAGTVLALPLLLGQILGVSWLAETSPFWRHVGRLSGTFSDPNAWGVYTLCLVPLLLHNRRYLLAALWFGLSLFSGSRLLVLGAGLLGLILLLSSLRRIREFEYHLKVRPVIVGGTILIFLLSLMMSFGWEVPIPLQRQLAALDVTRILDTFDSRMKFWRIAADVWRQWPLMGVGLNTFPIVLTSHAATLGNDLNFWVDNPNSTYLWLLAEMGVVGFLSLVLGGFELKLNESLSWILLSAVLVLVLVLQFGPHIFFVEFAVLASLLFSKVFARTQVLSFKGLEKALIFVMILSWSMYGQYGWYSWEREGPFAQRWSAPQSRAYFGCQAGVVAFQIRTIANRRVQIRSAYEQLDLSLGAGMWHNVELHCNSTLRVGFNVEDSWIPATSGFDGDWRLLGVQLRVSPEKAFVLG